MSSCSRDSSAAGTIELSALRGPSAPTTTPSSSPPKYTSPAIRPPQPTSLRSPLSVKIPSPSPSPPPSSTTETPNPTALLLTYAITAYHLPSLRHGDPTARYISLPITLTLSSWSVLLSPPFDSTKPGNTLYHLPAPPLHTKPHPICSCGRAGREESRRQELYQERERQAAAAEKQRERGGRSRAGSVNPTTSATTTPTSSRSRAGSVITAITTPVTPKVEEETRLEGIRENEAQPQEQQQEAEEGFVTSWSCTSACRLRRPGGSASRNPWKSRCEEGVIQVEYFLFVAPLSDEIPEIAGDEEREAEEEGKGVPLLEAEGWEGFEATPVPLWKREMVMVRVEDRLPVDVNAADAEGREWGEEVQGLERWLRIRCGIHNENAEWRERFDLKRLKESLGSRHV